nr:hypothetical protein BaRGS_017604 [Batillaria attramentaria]
MAYAPRGARGLRKLHCPRNTIHLNLFASFILRATMSFMKENLLVEGLGFHSDVIETDDGIQFRRTARKRVHSSKVPMPL